MSQNGYFKAAAPFSAAQALRTSSGTAEFTRIAVRQRLIRPISMCLVSMRLQVRFAGGGNEDFARFLGGFPPVDRRPANASCRNIERTATVRPEIGHAVQRLRGAAYCPGVTLGKSNLDRIAPFDMSHEYSPPQAGA
jgi:hypothetical protein